MYPVMLMDGVLQQLNNEFLRISYRYLKEKRKILLFYCLKQQKVFKY